MSERTEEYLGEFIGAIRTALGPFDLPDVDPTIRIEALRMEAEVQGERLAELQQAARRLVGARATARAAYTAHERESRHRSSRETYEAYLAAVEEEDSAFASLAALLPESTP